MSTEPPWYTKEYKKQLTAKPERRLLNHVEQQLLSEISERNAQRDTAHFHPSELSKEDWCGRQAFYKLTDESVSNPDSFSFQRMNLFEEGHYIHAKWQRWMDRAGILVGDWKCQRCDHRWHDKSPERCPRCYEMDIVYKEVPIYHEGLRIIGHADGWIRDEYGDALVELKSVGLGTIRWDAPILYSAYENGDIGLDELWKRIKRPLATHNRQIQLYMFCTGIHDAIVIYEWKPTQDVKEFHVKYSSAVVQPMIEEVKLVTKAIEADEVPDRPAGAGRSVRMCKFCPYKDKCYA